MTAFASRPVGRVVLVPLAALVLAAAGCGPTTTLVDSGGAVHQAEIQPDGGYSIPKVPTGSVRIAVSVPKANPNKPAPFGGKVEPPTQAQANLPDVPIELASPDTSGLTGTVAPGKPLDVDIAK
jgi:hypothetical protein